MSLFMEFTDWMPPTVWPELSGQMIAVDLETKDPMLKTHGPGWPFRRTLGDAAGFPVGYGVAANDWAGYYPTRHTHGNVDEERTRRWLQGILADETNTIVCQNAPYDVGWLAADGFEIKAKVLDTMVMAVLVDENRFSYGLFNLLKTHVPELKKSTDDMIAQAAAYGINNPYERMDELPPLIVGPYAEDDVIGTLALAKVLLKTIDNNGLRQIFDLETQLQPVIHKMRMRGVPVDIEGTQREIEAAQGRKDSAVEELQDLTGRSVDVWASDSVVHALDAVGIEYPTTDKGAPSIVADWLVAQKHRVTDLIVEARRQHKLRSTFLENYIINHEVGGRVHAQFNALRGDTTDGGKVVGAVTGRLSSSDPNLQNLSARNPEMGKIVRGAFLPEDGCDWLSVDYSAQEPRLMVHYAILLKLAGSEELRQAYIANPRTDFHQMAADITGLSRKQTKAISLGLAYGMGGAKLALDMGLPTEERERWNGRGVFLAAGPEAQAILDRYEAEFPFVPKLAEYATKRAERKGAITTLLGRRRRFARKGQPDGTRAAFPYKALNCLIQGSAADQAKRAMIDADNAGLCLTISLHDELCFSVSSQREIDMAQEVMLEAVKLQIPSAVDAEIGPNWGNLKPVGE